MRLIDVDKLITELKIEIGEVHNPEIIEGIILAIKHIGEQPTVSSQCIATVKVDFSKEDIEKLVEQKVKESIEFNLDSLKELLMEYFRIGVDCYTYNLTGDKSSYKCGTVKVNDFEEFNEDAVNDIVDFIKERISTCNFS